MKNAHGTYKVQYMYRMEAINQMSRITIAINNLGYVFLCERYVGVPGGVH